MAERVAREDMLALPRRERREECATGTICMGDAAAGVAPAVVERVSEVRGL